MSIEEEEKRKYENKLVLAYEEIPFASKSLDWLSSAEYRAFVSSWKDLREVYIKYDTLVDFHVEVIGVYRNITEYLRKLIVENTDNQEALTTASEALNQIEYWIGEVVNEAQRNQYFIEDMDDEA